MKNFYTNVGGRIKGNRTEQGLSRDNLADKAGISGRFLYDIERGKKGMSAETIYKLAQALETSTDLLLGGNEINVT